MNDNLKTQKTYSIIPNEHIYRIKLLFRKNLPTCQLIFFIITVLKYTPILLFTHAIPPNTPQYILSLSKIFKAITTFNSTSWQYSYISLCLIIYIFMLCILFCCIFVILYFKLHAKNTDDKLYGIPNNKIILSFKMKTFIKILTYMFLIFICIYQHIVEILFREIFCYCIKEEDHSLLVNDMDWKDILNDKKLPLLIFNGIFIIIGLLFLYTYFILVETYSMNTTFGYKSTMSSICIYTNMILFSLLGCYSSLNLLLKPNHVFIFVTYICTIFCFINSLTRLRLIQVNGKHALINNIFIYANDFCFVSGIFEIIIYHSLSDPYFHSQRFYFEKLICDIVNTILYTWLIKLLTKRFFIKRLVNTFFSEYRYFNLRDYHNFYLYLDSFNNSLSKKFVFVYNLYYLHKKVCTIDNCQCKLIEETSLSMHESEFSKTVELFLSIVEDKLNDSIHSNSIYKESGISTISPFLVIYVDNLFNVRKNKSLTIYTAQYYLIQYNHILTYDNAYTLYEINYLSYKMFKKENKERKKKEMCYIQKNLLREKVEKVTLLLCMVLERFFHYKNIKNSGGKILYTCEDVINVLDKYVKYNHILIKLLCKCLDIGLFDDIEELKFSIINFNRIIHLNLPPKYANKLQHLNTPHIHNDITSYTKHLTKLHMILYLKVDNIFIIRYASLGLSMCLLYNKDELIDKDFNRVLIPNVISQSHNLYMKHFILYGFMNYIKKTFLVNKIKQLLPVNVNVKVLPTLITLSNLILQIDMNDDSLYKQYHLMLDSDYKLISMSRSFEEEFVFTLDMFKLVKLNFCDFFGLNKERINQFFHYSNPKALRKVTHIQEESQQLTTGTTCIDSFIRNHHKDNNVSHLIDMSYFKDRFGNKTFIQPQSLNSTLVETINKETIISSISKLIKSINEYGLEKEWKEKLDFLYYKFTTLHLQHGSNASLFMQDNTTLKKTQTILSHQNTSLNNSNQNIFFVLFDKKSIGQLSYFITTISEEKKNEIETGQTVTNTKTANYNNTIIQRFNLQNVFIGNALVDIPFLNVKMRSPIIRASTQNYSAATDRSYTMTTPKSGQNSNIASDARLIHKENSDILYQPSESLSGTATGLMANQSRNQLIKIDQRNEENKKKVKFPKDMLGLSLRNINTVNKERYNSITTTYTGNNQTITKLKHNHNFNDYKNFQIMFKKLETKENRLRCFKQCIFFCFFLLALLNVINLILTYQLSEFSLHLFKINTYTFLIANDLYYGSLLAVIGCLYNAKYQNGNSTNAKFLLNQSSEDLINHYHSLNAHISYLINNQEIKPFFDTLNSPIEFSIIKSNWEHTTRKAPFNEELYSIYYYLKTFDPTQTEDDYQFCRIKEIFIDGNIKGKEPTKEEKFLIYIILNMVSSISSVLENLMKQISNINQNHYNSTTVKSNGIKSVILALIVILFICEIIILKTLIYLFQEKMFYLFYPNDKEIILIDSLKKYKNIYKPIETKTNNPSLQNNATKKEVVWNNSVNTHNSTNSTIISPRKGRQIGIKKKESSKFVPYNSMKNELKHPRSKKSLNETTISRRNNRKEQGIKQIQTTLQGVNPEKETRSFKKIYRLKIVNYFLSILIIIYCIYLILEVISMYISSEENDGLIIENKFAINFLSRSPKINELILYAIICVLRNKQEYIIKPYEMYDEYVISNHYNVHLDILSDSFVTSLGNCNYAYLYYQLHIIRTNIQMFVNDRTLFKYLRETTKAEFLFNDGYNFCIYAPLVYFQYYYEGLTNKDEIFIYYWNREVKKCRTIGNGMNSAGYKSGIDVMLDIINNMYFSFYHGDISTRQEIFLSNSKLKNVLENTIYMLRILHFSNAFLSIDDIQRTYNDKETLILLFSIVLIGFSLFIISGISLTIVILLGKKVYLVGQAVQDITISLNNIIM